MKISEANFITTFECSRLPLYNYNSIKLDHSQVVAIKTLKNVFLFLNDNPFEDLDTIIYQSFHKCIRYFSQENMPEIKQLFKYVTLFIYNFNKLYSFHKYRLLLFDLQVPSESVYVNVNLKYDFILRDIATKRFSKKFVAVSFYPRIDNQIKRMQDFFEYKALLLSERLEESFNKVNVNFSVISYAKIRSENDKKFKDELTSIQIDNSKIKNKDYYSKIFETFYVLNKHKINPFCTRFNCPKRSECFK